MSDGRANGYAVCLGQNFKLCGIKGWGIFLLGERCRFFCDWVQDVVVNRFSRNEALRLRSGQALSRNVEKWGGTGFHILTREVFTLVV